MRIMKSILRRLPDGEDEECNIEYSGKKRKLNQLE